MKFSTLTLACIATLASSTFVSQPSFGQQPSLLLEEIIVTAQKRSQSLQDVPLSVNAFTGSELRALGAVDFSDLSTRLSNINISSDQDNIDIAIRGVSNNRGFDPATAFHIDGIYTSQGLSGLSAFLDVERVEILRGPAGTLYGRNATAGAVNVISRRPNSEAVSGNVEFTVGDYDHVNAQFGINLPLIEDVLALRVSGLRDDREGYSKHKGLGFNVANSDDSDVRSARLRMLWTPNDTVSWLVGYDRTDVGGSGRRLLIDPQRSAEGTQALNRLPNLDPNLSARILADPRYVPVTDPLSEDIKQSGLMSELSITLGDWNLIYLAGTREIEQARVSDTDFYIGENFVVDSFLDAKEASHEIRVSTSTDTLDWLIGLYYFESDVDSGFEQIIVPSFANFSDFRDGKNESLGVFTQGTYSFSEEWRLTLGLRYSEDEKTQPLTTQGFGNPANIDLSMVEPYDRDPPVKFDDVSWKASLEWDVAEDSLLYLSASTGYKTGGFNSDPDLSKYDEETILAVELGSKNQFLDGRLQLNGALFWYDYEGLQISGLRVLTDDDGEFVRAVGVQDNLDAVDVYGAELEWIWLATDSIRIDGGLGLLKAEVDSGRVDDILRADDNEFGGVVVSGNSLRKSPELSFNLGLQHELSLGAGLIRTRLDFHYEDEQFHDVINRPIDREPSYTKTDFSIMYEAADAAWFVQAFVRNIEDDDIRTAIFQTPLGAISQLAAPRTYGVRAGLEF